MGSSSTDETVVTRSGSAIDVNQMSAGGTIRITDSTFRYCGVDSTSGTTSGAIKVKVRGGIDDLATDIPGAAAGSLEELIVQNCTFIENRADVVLGTSKYASTDDFVHDNIQECKLENNAELNLLIVETSKKLSELGKLSGYDGIKGTSRNVVLTFDKPLQLTDESFYFESITLDGGGEEKDGKEDPKGIDFSTSRKNVSLTIKDCNVREFGYAISSNKANGNGETGTVNKGSLTLIIENSSFSDCFKGLYATDIRNLKITDSDFKDMGTHSTSTGVVDRSGSAIDVNQMSAGEIISITGSSFTRCGDPNETDEKITSGAIKVKVRGNGDDDEKDIPYVAAAGSLTLLRIQDCEFSDNRADVVLGTSGHASTAAFAADIQNCDIEDNSQPKA